MNFMKKKRLSLTVGIATCFGDSTILNTLKSLRSSKGVGKFRLIIIADRTPISSSLSKQIKSYGAELIENKFVGSQMSKQRQFIAMTNSDLLIITQDDVLFDSNTLDKVVQEFEDNSETTMVSILNKPVKPSNMFEKALGTGTNIVNTMAGEWNNGDNYLAVIGRFIAFRTNFLRNKITLNKKVSTCDAYYYFSNKNAGGVFKYLPDIAVCFKNPQNFTEHLRKSSRFQFSKLEMLKYFQTLNLEREYKLPKKIVIKTLLKEFLSKQIPFIYYLLIFMSSRILKMKVDKALNTIWEIDLSTKTLT